MALSNEPSALSKIKLSNAIYPIIIGLGVVGYMMYKDFNPEVFHDINFTWASLFWIVMAFVFMFGRDFGYMIRIRVLSDNVLTWRKAFRVIMLWEFTSAITPSAVGGTAVALVYVHKEGITVGRSTAIVLLTSFLDEIYFIVMFPLVVLIAGVSGLFDISSVGEDEFKMGLTTLAIIAYSLKFAYVIMVSYGLFINPHGLKWLLINIFKIRCLRKWRATAEKVGTDIITSSEEFKQKSFGFWFKAVGSTFVSWSSRYLVANALIMAFFGVSDQFLLFARQLVIWIVMLVMPTPGGSGFAEYIFSYFCGDLIVITESLQKGAATLIAFLWRAITYYPYLIVGAVIFPRWLRRNFVLRPKKKRHKTSKIA